MKWPVTDFIPILLHSCHWFHCDWTKKSCDDIFKCHGSNISCRLYTESSKSVQLQGLYLPTNKYSLVNVVCVYDSYTSCPLLVCQVRYPYRNWYSYGKYQIFHLKINKLMSVAELNMCDWYSLMFKHYRYGEIDQNVNEFTLTKVYTMVIGAFTRRGYNFPPTTWKARIAFTRWIWLWKSFEQLLR